MFLVCSVHARARRTSSPDKNTVTQLLSLIFMRSRSRFSSAGGLGSYHNSLGVFRRGMASPPWGAVVVTSEFRLEHSSENKQTQSAEIGLEENPKIVSLKTTLILLNQGFLWQCPDGPARLSGPTSRVIGISPPGSSDRDGPLRRNARAIPTPAPSL